MAKDKWSLFTTLRVGMKFRPCADDGQGQVEQPGAGGGAESCGRHSPAGQGCPSPTQGKDLKHLPLGFRVGFAGSGRSDGFRVSETNVSGGGGGVRSRSVL